MGSSAISGGISRRIPRIPPVVPPLLPRRGQDHRVAVCKQTCTETDSAGSFLRKQIETKSPASITRFLTRTIRAWSSPAHTQKKIFRPGPLPANKRTSGIRGQRSAIQPRTDRYRSAIQPRTDRYPSAIQPRTDPYRSAIQPRTDRYSGGHSDGDSRVTASNICTHHAPSEDTSFPGSPPPRGLSRTAPTTPDIRRGTAPLTPVIVHAVFGEGS